MCAATRFQQISGRCLAYERLPMIGPKDKDPHDNSGAAFERLVEKLFEIDGDEDEDDE